MKTKENKLDFLKSFYGNADKKRVRKSLPNPAEIYRKYRFTFWFWLSLAAALISGGIFIKTMPLFGVFGFILLFILFIGFKLYGFVGLIFAIPIGVLIMSLYNFGLFNNLIYLLQINQLKI